MRVTFVSSGLEHLGVSALSSYLTSHGHDVRLVYEPKPFSSNSGPDSALLARLLEPTPSQVAEKIANTSPDVAAFSSYTITHGWSVQVARALKRIVNVPIVFGGPHVSGAPERSIREAAIDAVVEGEGEGALLDLVECARDGRFTRHDVPNTWVKGTLKPKPNPLRPLIEDLDALPWADKQIFYDHIPAFENEFYIVSRRGCPYRCSFCEYSIFPRQYPGEKPVRRRSVQHVIGELGKWKARGRMRKVFFWDAIFTLDARWMEEFAEAYRTEIGIPFECYSHPQALSSEMAQLLAHAGCSMVRVGVQTVNSDTLATMDRRGTRERVTRTIGYLQEAGIPYALDHIIGLPGEGPDDQREAIRFYNDVRPARIVAHWMTYFPGTTAFDRARKEGILRSDQVERILLGESKEGFEAPRLVGPSAHADALKEIRKLAVLFDVLPLFSRRTISWLLESGTYRFLPRGLFIRQIIALAQALVGEEATRARMRTILAAALGGFARPARAALDRLRVGSSSVPARGPVSSHASAPADAAPPAPAAAQQY